MKITIIAGARPNFMKIAPIIHAINRFNNQAPVASISYRLVHTGQHYDARMSDTFFKQLGIPDPHVNLGGGGGTQAEQTAQIMVAFEKELSANPADLVLVVGDVTSTMACAIVAKKLHTKVAHVEAGIRSFDLSMPEEINRMVTDAITDYFFTTTAWAGSNLEKTGISKEKIFFVGNVMIDTLLANMPHFQAPDFYETLGLKEKEYLVMTLHRPGNVDEEQKFIDLIHTIISSTAGCPIVFPVHPRTRAIIDRLIEAGNFDTAIEQLHMVEPLGYFEFNYLVKNAKGVITDSGGITEETTVMGIPCITLRENTERPETCEMGTNELVGSAPEKVSVALNKLLAGNWKKGTIPPLWDGKAAERIVSHLANIYGC